MNAGIDQNRIKTQLASLNTDGLTIIPLKANAVTHGLKVSNGTTGTDFGNDVARDGNREPICIVQSSDGSGAIITLYADSAGFLQIKST